MISLGRLRDSVLSVWQTLPATIRSQRSSEEQAGMDCQGPMMSTRHHYSLCDLCWD